MSGGLSLTGERLILGEVRVGLALVRGLAESVVVEDSTGLVVRVAGSEAVAAGSTGLAVRAAGLLGSSACGHVLFGAGSSVTSCDLLPGVGSTRARGSVVGGVDHCIGAGRIILPLPLPLPLGCRLAAVKSGGTPLRLAGGGEVKVAGLELWIALAPDPGCLAAICASITGLLQER